MTRAYFDHAAAAPLRPAAREALLREVALTSGNASSVHREGQRARAALEEARALVAAALGCPDDEIVFTGSGTESANLALRGVVWAAGRRPAHVVSTSIEHEAVLRTLRFLEVRGDARVTLVAPSAEGVVDADEVLAAVRPDTALVSVMAVNNETGALQPVARLGAALRERGIPFHVDAVQAPGRAPLGFAADLVTLSACKCGGPAGQGVLRARRGLKLVPALTGGAQERGLRPGTENVAVVAAGARALALAMATSAAELEGLAVLSRRLESGLLALPGARLNGPPDGRAAGFVNVGFDDADGRLLVEALDLRGFSVSTGSACTAGSTAPSHVLAAMGQAEPRARSAVRFSLGSTNSLDEVDRLLAVLPDVLAAARAHAAARC